MLDICCTQISLVTLACMYVCLVGLTGLWTHPGIFLNQILTGCVFKKIFSSSFLMRVCFDAHIWSSLNKTDKTVGIMGGIFIFLDNKLLSVSAQLQFSLLFSMVTSHS